MRKCVALLLIYVFICSQLNAQTPQSVPYQAVARNTAGNLLVNQNVSLRFTVHDVSSSGSILYQETQSATTNSLGLFSLNVGTGTVISGTFSAISWGNGNAKYLQVEIDPAGGSSYTNMGATQMMSVPYAMYAASAGSAGGTAGGDLTGTYPNPSLVATGSVGTYTKVTTDSKGRVTSGTTLASTDIPSGSTNYIQNNTTQQTNANYNISGSGTIGGNLTLTGGQLNVTTTIGSSTTASAVLTGSSSNTNYSNYEPLQLNNNGYYAGAVSALGFYNSGTTYPTGKIISTLNSSGTGAKMDFYTMNNSNASTKRLTIDNAGNVGIGVPSPAVPLDVTGAGTVGIRYIKTGSADARISVGDNSNTVWSWSCGWGAGGGGASGDFGLLQEGISGNVIYVQKATNNVGIGTSTPSYTFDVNGTGHFAGNLTTGGSSSVGGNLTVSGAITGRVWSTSLPANTNYSSTATQLLSTTVTSHGGTLVITGKVLDQTNNNSANRNEVYLYRTTSASGYTGTGSQLLDTWSFWQSAGGLINESATVTYSEQLSAGTYYYWLVGQCEVSGQTRTALTAGTRLIVYEF